MMAASDADYREAGTPQRRDHLPASRSGAVEPYSDREALHPYELCIRRRVTLNLEAQLNSLANALLSNSRREQETELPGRLQLTLQSSILFWTITVLVGSFWAAQRS